MKKFYSLFAIAFCAYSVGAGAAERSATLGLRSDIKECKAITKMDSKKVETRADEEWKSIGKGIYREGLVSSVFDVDPQDIEVEMEQNIEDPTMYRIVNPYENWENPFSNVEYDASGTYYIYFSIVEYNGKKVWYFTQDSNLGLIFPTISQGISGMLSTMTMGNQAHEYGVEAFASVYGEDALGIYSGDGLLTYPYDFTFEYEGEEITEYNLWIHFSSQQPNYGIPVNERNIFAIALPGVEMKDYDPFEGYNLVGDCKMQNNIFPNYFQEWKTPEATVTVYEHPNRKGELHIKNAFLAGDWNSEEAAKLMDLTIDLSDPNYGFIPWTDTFYEDVEYGETVIMSTSCFWERYAVEGKLTKEEFLKQYPEKNIYIDVANKKIIMPVQSVGILFPDAPEDSEVYSAITWAQDTPESKESWIQLPADYVLPVSAVNSISADDANAPVKYFNLQGMEVANPEAGQIVIKKQGSKATKFIAK